MWQEWPQETGRSGPVHTVRSQPLSKLGQAIMEEKSLSQSHPGGQAAWHQCPADTLPS